MLSVQLSCPVFSVWFLLIPVSSSLVMRTHESNMSATTRPNKNEAMRFALSTCTQIFLQDRFLKKRKPMHPCNIVRISPFLPVEQQYIFHCTAHRGVQRLHWHICPPRFCAVLWGAFRRAVSFFMQKAALRSGKVRYFTSIKNFSIRIG